jgi:hypothetical protein
VTQSQCPIFLFFLILLIFQNSNVLVINRFQWLISAEGQITYNFWYHNIYKMCFFKFRFWGFGGAGCSTAASPDLGAPLTSGFHAPKNFSENYHQFGHAPSESFASPVAGLESLKGRQIIRLPGVPTYLGPARSGRCPFGVTVKLSFGVTVRRDGKEWPTQLS